MLVFRTGILLWNQWTFASGYELTKQSTFASSPGAVWTIFSSTLISGLTERVKRGNHWLSFNVLDAHTNQKHFTTHNLQPAEVQPMRPFQYRYRPHILSLRPCRNASHRPYNDACRCLAKPHAVHYAATELWVEEHLWLRIRFEKSHRVWCWRCPMERFWPLAPLRWKQEWMRRDVFNQWACQISWNRA